MSATIADVNRTLWGWFEYFKHSHQKTFRTKMDSSDAGCEAYCAVKPIGRGVPERMAPTRHAGRPSRSMSVLSQVRPPTGKPYVGRPHVQFGGRGHRNQSMLPTPIVTRRTPPAVATVGWNGLDLRVVLNAD
jgi:hypothetical protein